MKTASRMIAAVVMTFLASTLVLVSSDIRNNASAFSAFSSGVSDAVAYFTLPLAMLLGMLAQAVHARIRALPSGADTIDVKGALRDAVNGAGFWSAITVSPIVFAAVYLVTREQPDIVISHLLAFENGFFWRAVFESRETEPRGRPGRER